MTGLRIAVLFCVFIIQRTASQGCSCQSELYISIDDLMKALANGPGNLGIPGLLEGNQQSCGNQQSSGNQQSLGNQLSCSCNQQSCSCNQQSQPSISITNRPISLGQVKQPLSISSIPASNQCGCQQSISLSQLSQQCQPSLSIGQPSKQPGCQQKQSLTISNPSISFQPISQCGQQVQVNNVQSKSNQGNQVPEVTCIVPAALLQAPPYGIIFAGDNLLIDGAVQVCGNLPFNSVIELSGIVPTSGSGYVQYVCDDTC